MAGLPALADLSINGLPLNLPAGTDTIPKENIDRFILQVGRAGNVLTFNGHPSGPITLNLGTELGRGVFGRVYNTDSVIDPGVALIVKVLNFAPVIANHTPAPPDTFGPGDRMRVINDFKYNTLLESLSQIIVHDTTEGVRFPEINLQGPFASKFYLLGSDTDSLYIVSEALDDTVLNRLFPKIPGEQIRTPAKGQLFKTAILQISKIYEYLYDNLQFLHRDSKPDNIMYKIIDGRIHVRLIDFGLSCMTYHNVNIQTDQTYWGIMHCNSRIRDMYTFLWQIRNRLFNDHNLARGCDFADILNIILTRGWSEPFNWEVAYRGSNLDEPGAISNCDARAVYNIFNALNFTFDDLESNITGPWPTQLVLLISNLGGKLSIEQLLQIDPHIITDSRNYEVSPFSNLMRVNDDRADFDGRFANFDDLMALKTGRNKRGQTPLMLACALNNEYAVGRIAGLDRVKLAVQDMDGNTCLHFACRTASALMNDEVGWTKAVRIIERLLRQNPILSEIRNYDNQGPGNPAVSTDPRIRDYVKRVKTYWWQLKRNPDTNVKTGGSSGGRSTRRSTRHRCAQTRRLR
jgi:hypothetical protein